MYNFFCTSDIVVFLRVVLSLLVMRLALGKNYLNTELLEGFEASISAQVYSALHTIYLEREISFLEATLSKEREREGYVIPKHHYGDHFAYLCELGYNTFSNSSII